MANLVWCRHLLKNAHFSTFAKLSGRALILQKSFVLQGSSCWNQFSSNAFGVVNGSSRLVVKTGSIKFFSTESGNGGNTGSRDYINSLVHKNKVVIFMKGVPEKPLCGFSNAVVQILRMHGVEYDSYNVLEDDALRSGIKEYSEWPTIPQIFMNGEFVGGCDILLQMHQSGDLVDELKAVGIRSALLDKK